MPLPSCCASLTAKHGVARPDQHQEYASAEGLIGFPRDDKGPRALMQLRHLGAEDVLRNEVVGSNRPHVPSLIAIANEEQTGEEVQLVSRLNVVVFLLFDLRHLR